ncbi:MAG: ABC transporter permease [Dysgonamonadaceae bacterium]|jgi:ABC-2 type transport system permease protein|nr:ABC transporter permease [Dysgonamonadaceae bacterium]
MKLKNSQFLSFVKKEFLYILRDTWTMIILLLLPVLMIILFGFGISTEIKNTRVAVFDPSRDMATQQIVNNLSKSEYFIIDSYFTDISEIEQVLKKGEIGLAVVFSPNFNENMNRGSASIQLITDGSDPNTASSLTNYATAIINQWQIENRKPSTVNSQIPNINCQLKLLYNPTMKGAYNTVPGVLGLVIMLICTMMTAVSIAREKETGSMEVLLVSPVKPVTIILSKTVPYFALSLFNFATALLLSIFVLKVPIAGSLYLLTGLTMIFIFLCLSLGVLISIVAPSQIVAMLVSAVVMMMPTMLLSGLMFPIENMPLVLQWVAQILPVKWFIEAARNIMIKGAGISTIAQELLVLAGMTVLLLIISMKKFNKRLG